MRARKRRAEGGTAIAAATAAATAERAKRAKRAKLPELVSHAAPRAASASSADASVSSTAGLPKVTNSASRGVKGGPLRVCPPGVATRAMERKQERLLRLPEALLVVCASFAHQRDVARLCRTCARMRPLMTRPGALHTLDLSGVVAVQDGADGADDSAVPLLYRRATRLPVTQLLHLCRCLQPSVLVMPTDAWRVCFLAELGSADTRQPGKPGKPGRRGARSKPRRCDRSGEGESKGSKGSKGAGPAPTEDGRFVVPAPLHGPTPGPMPGLLPRLLHLRGAEIPHWAVESELPISFAACSALRTLDVEGSHGGDLPVPWWTCGTLPPHVRLTSLATLIGQPLPASVSLPVVQQARSILRQSPLCHLTCSFACTFDYDPADHQPHRRSVHWLRDMVGAGPSATTVVAGAAAGVASVVAAAGGAGGAGGAAAGANSTALTPAAAVWRTTLESLKLVEVTQGFADLAFMADLPRLRRLHLIGCASPVPLLAFDAWKRLTHLTLEKYCEIWPHVSRCTWPCLESLTILGHSDSGIANGSRVHARNLADATQWIEWAVTRAAAPALASLRVSVTWSRALLPALAAPLAAAVPAVAARRRGTPPRPSASAASSALQAAPPARRGATSAHSAGAMGYRLRSAPPTVTTSTASAASTASIANGLHAPSGSVASAAAAATRPSGPSGPSEPSESVARAKAVPPVSDVPSGPAEPVAVWLRFDEWASKPSEWHEVPRQALAALATRAIAQVDGKSRLRLVAID